ncbi:transmembrane protease serine 11D-like [Schistocerca serialis cubense]|uniref:transmembrane protease serine 11D-like n=1 Tax=Schistocerca serialis cubense TaxID=2023355 RepID=UPI00214E39C3|nr:transmembrane protease serine 11D-like [Schistocerca serialis cubense]
MKIHEILYTVEAIYVHAGTTQLSADSGVVVAVTDIVVHEGFDEMAYTNDVALLKLAQSLSFSSTIQAVSLSASGQQTAASTTATVVGWGSTESSSSFVSGLRKVDVPVWLDAYCAATYENYYMYTRETNICAGESGKGKCGYDVGGPLLVNGQQVGVASWDGYDCATAGSPGVYAEVSYYVDWISQNAVLLYADDAGDAALVANSEDELQYLINKLLHSCGKFGLTISLQKSKIMAHGTTNLPSISIDGNPLQVSILVNGNFKCGGTIINQNWVLTAAHCIDGYGAGSITVHAGSTSSTSSGTTVGVSTTIINDSFDNLEYTDDIALLGLSQSLSFSSTIAAVSLPSSGQQTSAGATGTVVGWGSTSKSSAVSSLRKVNVAVWSDSDCQSTYSDYIYLFMPAMNICAGDSGKGSCDGDDGGPLLVNGQQVGISSWNGFDCATSQYPGVFVEVSYYVDWINQNTR